MHHIFTREDSHLNHENQTPFTQLHPDAILDAVESTSFRCTGNLLALNSYENRVYQIGVEEAEPIIAKCYRPHRWSSDAILEEHQFSIEIVQHELPVIAPLIKNDQTLHQHNEFRFALFPKRGGHALELDNKEQLEMDGTLYRTFTSNQCMSVIPTSHSVKHSKLH